MMSWTVVVCLLGLWSANAEFTCPRINGVKEECKSIYDCPYVMERIGWYPLKMEVRNVLMKYHCGFEGFVPFVCCSDRLASEIPLTTEATPTVTSVPEQTTSTIDTEVDNTILPPELCGVYSDSNKILDGDNTAIDEFPWMVLLGYRLENNTVVFKCGGFIINNRYILTAAHCVRGSIIKKYGPLEIIRVGEYDMRTEIDCVNTTHSGECAPPHQDVGIDEVIPHAGYVDGKINREDDIAIVRLSRNLKFNFFVQPICLSDTQLRSASRDFFFVSGWGATLTASKSDIKQKLQIPTFDKTACNEIYSRANAKLTDKQLCAGGEDEKDTCTGDSGGPLMKLNDDKWYAIGVVSFGNGCGTPGWPGVYTNVYMYMDWIKNNLKP